MDSFMNVQRSRKFPQFCYGVLAGLYGVVIGTAMGWNSPVTQLMIKGDASADEHSNQVTWRVAGCYCLGTTVGGLLQGLFNKVLCYKMSAIVYDLNVLIGWAILFQLNSNPFGSHAIWIGRFIQGIGTGGLGLLIPTYLSHITDFDIRGRVQIFHQLFVYFGISFAFVLGAIVSYSTLTALCMIWPVLLLFFTFFSPQSPFHLYKCDAETVKTAMHQIKGDDYDVESDYNELQNYMGFYKTEDVDPPMDYTTMIRRIRKITIIGIGLVVFQQTCGVNSVIFHMEWVFHDLCTTNELTFKAQHFVIVISVVQFLLCLPMIEFVEFLGRKFMLILSAVGMGISLMGLMIMYMVFSPTYLCMGSDWLNTLIIALIYVYICSYSLGWGTVVMLVYTEIVYFDKWFSSVIYAGGQFTMFLIMCPFFNIDTLKSNTYTLWMYIVSCIASVVFVKVFVPDTRAKHLGRIQTMLDD